MKYTISMSPDALRSRVGRMDQVAGIQMLQLDDGKARGCRIARFYTGSGLEFTVNLDRCMDLSSASYSGAAMGWRSTTGDVAPQYYEAEGIRWLRSFNGGLLTTCGTQNVGPPASDSPESGNGLHGRIANTPAEDIRCSQAWSGDTYLLSLSGTIRETSVFGVNLALHRTISTQLGSDVISLRDELVNEGFTPAHFMMLYHCNIGWPALDAGSQILAPTQKVTPRNETAQEGAQDWYKMDAPTPGYAEKVYFHEMKPDATGWVSAAIVNKEMIKDGTGFGVCVRYKADTLPSFVQWKQMGTQEYVLGLEPSTCKVVGVDEDTAAGNLEFLQPGEKKVFQLEYSPIYSKEQYENLAAISNSTDAPIA